MNTKVIVDAKFIQDILNFEGLTAAILKNHAENIKGTSKSIILLSLVSGTLMALAVINNKKIKKLENKVKKLENELPYTLDEDDVGLTTE